MANHKPKRASIRSGDDEEVGYGRPPKKHQFRKGEPSANPYGCRGKPKAEVPVQAAEPDFLDELVPITIDGKRQRVTRDQSVDHALCLRAIRGDVAAARELSVRRSLREKRRAAAERSLAAEIAAPVTAEDEALIARSFSRKEGKQGGEADLTGEQGAGDE